MERTVETVTKPTEETVKPESPKPEYAVEDISLGQAERAPQEYSEGPAPQVFEQQSVVETIEVTKQPEKQVETLTEIVEINELHIKPESPKPEYAEIDISLGKPELAPEEYAEQPEQQVLEKESIVETAEVIKQPEREYAELDVSLGQPSFAPMETTKETVLQQVVEEQPSDVEVVTTKTTETVETLTFVENIGEKVQREFAEIQFQPEQLPQVEKTIDTATTETSELHVKAESPKQEYAETDISLGKPEAAQEEYTELPNQQVVEKVIVAGTTEGVKQPEREYATTEKTLETVTEIVQTTETTELHIKPEYPRQEYAEIDISLGQAELAQEEYAIPKRQVVEKEASVEAAAVKQPVREFAELDVSLDRPSFAPLETATENVQQQFIEEIIPGSEIITTTSVKSVQTITLEEKVLEQPQQEYAKIKFQPEIKVEAETSADTNIIKKSATESPQPEFAEIAFQPEEKPKPESVVLTEEITITEVAEEQPKPEFAEVEFQPEEQPHVEEITITETTVVRESVEQLPQPEFAEIAFQPEEKPKPESVVLTEEITITEVAEEQPKPEFAEVEFQPEEQPHVEEITITETTVVRESVEQLPQPELAEIAFQPEEKPKPESVVLTEEITITEVAEEQPKPEFAEVEFQPEEQPHVEEITITETTVVRESVEQLLQPEFAETALQPVPEQKPKEQISEVEVEKSDFVLPTARKESLIGETVMPLQITVAPKQTVELKEESSLQEANRLSVPTEKAFGIQVDLGQAELLSTQHFTITELESFSAEEIVSRLIDQETVTQAEMAISTRAMEELGIEEKTVKLPRVKPEVAVKTTELTKIQPEVPQELGEGVVWAENVMNVSELSSATAEEVVARLNVKEEISEAEMVIPTKAVEQLGKEADVKLPRVSGEQEYNFELLSETKPTIEEAAASIVSQELLTDTAGITSVPTETAINIPVYAGKGKVLASATFNISELLTLSAEEVIVRLSEKEEIIHAEMALFRKAAQDLRIDEADIILPQVVATEETLNVTQAVFDKASDTTELTTLESALVSQTPAEGTKTVSLVSDEGQAEILTSRTFDVSELTALSAEEVFAKLMEKDEVAEVEMTFLKRAVETLKIEESEIILPSVKLQQLLPTSSEVQQVHEVVVKHDCPIEQIAENIFPGLFAGSFLADVQESVSVPTKIQSGETEVIAQNTFTLSDLTNLSAEGVFFALSEKESITESEMVLLTKAVEELGYEDIVLTLPKVKPTVLTTESDFQVAKKLAEELPEFSEVEVTYSKRPVDQAVSITFPAKDDQTVATAERPNLITATVTELNIEQAGTRIPSTITEIVTETVQTKQPEEKHVSTTETISLVQDISVVTRVEEETTPIIDVADFQEEESPIKKQTGPTEDVQGLQCLQSFGDVAMVTERTEQFPKTTVTDTKENLFLNQLVFDHTIPTNVIAKTQETENDQAERKSDTLPETAIERHGEIPMGVPLHEGLLSLDSDLISPATLAMEDWHEHCPTEVYSNVLDITQQFTLAAGVTQTDTVVVTEEVFREKTTVEQLEETVVTAELTSPVQVQGKDVTFVTQVPEAWNKETAQPSMEQPLPASLTESVTPELQSTAHILHEQQVFDVLVITEKKQMPEETIIEIVRNVSEAEVLRREFAEIELQPEEKPTERTITTETITVRETIEQLPQAEFAEIAFQPEQKPKREEVITETVPTVTEAEFVRPEYAEIQFQPEDRHVEQTIATETNTIRETIEEFPQPEFAEIEFQPERKPVSKDLFQQEQYETDTTIRRKVPDTQRETIQPVTFQVHAKKIVEEALPTPLVFVPHEKAELSFRLRPEKEETDVSEEFVEYHTFSVPTETIVSEMEYNQGPQIEEASSAF